jgi:hypothetical protein
MASEPALEGALATGRLAVQPPAAEGVAGKRPFAPAAFRHVTKLSQMRGAVYPSAVDPEAALAAFGSNVAPIDEPPVSPRS